MLKLRFEWQLYADCEFSDHVSGVPLGQAVRISNGSFVRKRGRKATGSTYEYWKKQEKFLRSLDHNPRYPKDVLEIKWTLSNHKIEDRYREAEKDVRTGRYKEFPDRIWKWLPHFTNVTRVELSEDSAGSALARSVPEYVRLFPKATSVTLIGTFTDRFLYLVLPSGNKLGQLKHLVLDHVRVYRYGGVGYMAICTVLFLRNLNTTCSSLESLSIFDVDYEMFEKGPPYVAFLDSLRDSLEGFYLKVTVSSLDRQQSVFNIRQRFEQLLLSGIWPCLVEKTILTPIGSVHPDCPHKRHTYPCSRRWCVLNHPLFLDLFLRDSLTAAILESTQVIGYYLILKISCGKINETSLNLVSPQKQFDRSKYIFSSFKA